MIEMQSRKNKISIMTTRFKTAAFASAFFLAFFMFLIPVFGGSPKNTVAKHDLTGAQYADMYADMKSKGFRLRCVSGYEENDQARFAAIWEKATGPTMATFQQMTSDVYQDKYTQYKNQGYKLIYVNAFPVNGTVYYSAIWIDEDGPDVKGFHGMTSAQYQDKYDDMKAQGYRLVHVSGVGVGNTANFAGIWRKETGPDIATHHMMTAADYQSKFTQYKNLGYRLMQVNNYTVGSTVYYAAIWRKTTGPDLLAHHGMNEENYQTTVLNYYYSGYTIESTSACVVNGKTTFSAIWNEGDFDHSNVVKINKKVQDFLDKWDMPGLTLAISKDEKLVFARGYGYADVDKGLLMGPQHIGRIASISKPFTAVAMQLLMSKFPSKVNINSKVFGAGSVLGSGYNTVALSSNENAIQIDNLLEHTAGGNVWDNNTFQDQAGSTTDENPKTGDPMFQNQDDNHKDLITGVLDNRNPDYTPGSFYAYSNFEYCILGRVIETVSGSNYAAWVKNNVLTPSGISQMFIAENDKADKRANEFVLYGKNGENPYSDNVKRMDSHGGWLASPIDLLRFAARVDGKSGKQDIISAAQYTSMTTRSSYTPNPVNQSAYAKGWSFNDGGIFHDGALPGMQSRLVIRNDGFSYALIVNSRLKSNNDFSGDFNAIVRELIEEINGWPTYDLF